MSRLSSGWVLAIACAFIWAGPPAAEAACEPQLYLIRGHSLSPRISSGTKLRGWPLSCAPELAQGDLVFASVAAHPTPVAKVVYALEGDTFELTPHDKSRFRLVINDELARNSRGIPFSLSAASAKLLQVYIRDYRGRVPAGAVLVLGDKVRGSLDATRFGLIARDSLLGVVVEGPVAPAPH